MANKGHVNAPCNFALYSKQGEESIPFCFFWSPILFLDNPSNGVFLVDVKRWTKE